MVLAIFVENQLSCLQVRVKVGMRTQNDYDYARAGYHLICLSNVQFCVTIMSSCRVVNMKLTNI